MCIFRRLSKIGRKIETRLGRRVDKLGPRGECRLLVLRRQDLSKLSILVNNRDQKVKTSRFNVCIQARVHHLCRLKKKYNFTQTVEC